MAGPKPAVLPITPRGSSVPNVSNLFADAKEDLGPTLVRFWALFDASGSEARRSGTENDGRGRYFWLWTLNANRCNSLAKSTLTTATRGDSRNVVGAKFKIPLTPPATN